MAELLVRVVDKTSPDPYLDAKLTKRGDVIVVVEDGWPWSAQERTDPDWRILKVPNLTAEQVSMFVSPEVPDDPAKTAMLRKRGWSINLDAIALSAPWKAWINDAMRAAPTRTLNITLAALLAYQVKKPALIDPHSFDAP